MNSKQNPMDIISKYTKESPVNIEGAIRELGIKLNKNAELPSGISGHLKRENGGYEIASSKKEHYFRQRFTLAHELGHYVLHRNLVDKSGGVDDNTKYRSTQDGDIYNTHIELKHESQANSFAATVLLPSELLVKDVESTLEEGRQPSLTDLYKKYQTSPSAMRWRLKRLGLYDDVTDD